MLRVTAHTHHVRNTHTHTYTGLSYSSFEYSELKVTGRNISVTITNTGKVPGTEIPQLYLGYPTVAVRFNQTFQPNDQRPMIEQAIEQMQTHHRQTTGQTEEAIHGHAFCTANADTARGLLIDKLRIHIYKDTVRFAFAFAFCALCL